MKTKRILKILMTFIIIIFSIYIVFFNKQILSENYYIKNYLISGENDNNIDDNNKGTIINDKNEIIESTENNNQDNKKWYNWK